MSLGVLVTTVTAAPTVKYNSATGVLSVDTTDGTLITSLSVLGPQATSIDRWLDGTNQDGFDWDQAYFAGREQWSATGNGLPPAIGSGVSPGVYNVARYAVGLDTTDFPELIELGGAGGAPTNFVALEIVSALLGDYNHNGNVDAADYTVWKDHFGSDAELDADGNGNGVVDAADYTIWKDNFGNTASLGLATAVPEPASLVLLVTAAMGVLRGRHRHT